MKYFRLGLLSALLMVQSCTAAVVATPTPGPPTMVPPSPTSKPSSPTPSTPTSEPPSPASPTATPEILDPTPTPTFEPPAGFRQYQDPVAGVAIYIPATWIVNNINPGWFAILQSYPEDKYIGGEAFQPGDTKCDLYIRPPGMRPADIIQQWKSNPDSTIVSEQEIVLQSGQPGTRFELESMGRSLALVTEIRGRAIVLTCFGEFAPFDEIAGTLQVSEILESTPSIDPSFFKQYQDSVAGVSVNMPGNWVVTGIVPDHRAVLQSYPEGKYVGGEAFLPGDTKCDLFIRPPDISAAEFVQQVRSNPDTTIISEREIFLNSGEPGWRIEMENMGRFLSMITEVNERVVVLNCFGDFTPFDEIAITISSGE